MAKSARENEKLFVYFIALVVTGLESQKGYRPNEITLPLIMY